MKLHLSTYLVDNYLPFLQKCNLCLWNSLCTMLCWFLTLINLRSKVFSYLSLCHSMLSQHFLALYTRWSLFFVWVLPYPSHPIYQHGHLGGITQQCWPCSTWAFVPSLKSLIDNDNGISESTAMFGITWGCRLLVVHNLDQQTMLVIFAFSVILLFSHLSLFNCSTACHCLGWRALIKNMM